MHISDQKISMIVIGISPYRMLSDKVSSLQAIREKIPMKYYRNIGNENHSYSVREPFFVQAHKVLRSVRYTLHICSHTWTLFMGVFLMIHTIIEDGHHT